MRREGRGGLGKVLFGRTWTEWLPIHAWLIEHREGLIVVDTGETARTSEPGYFPRWQPYFKLAVRMKVSPEEEIGQQIRSLGFDPHEVRKVILTHLHTDHAGGLHHFPNSEILVSGDEYRNAKGFRGMLQGYLPNRWPEWFEPKSIPFERKAFGPFEESFEATRSGDIAIVRTPGHTLHHLSVFVEISGIFYFLAGDTSYTEELLLIRQTDGVSPSPEIAIKTLDKITRFAQEETMVYLPTHDPKTEDRFRRSIPLKPSP